jgi:hypothetical protein
MFQVCTLVKLCLVVQHNVVNVDFIRIDRIESRHDIALIGSLSGVSRKIRRRVVGPRIDAAPRPEVSLGREPRQFVQGILIGLRDALHFE